MTIYFCAKHMVELQQRWGGRLQDAYPGEEIKLDANRCEYLGCPLRGRNTCPTCGQPLPSGKVLSR